MTIRRMFLALALLLCLVVQPMASSNAAAAPEPVASNVLTTPGIPLPTLPFEIYTQIAEISPGGSTPPHTHPGLLVGVILAGGLTFTDHMGVSKVYRFGGEPIVEHPNEHGLASNDGTDTVRTAVTVILPKGAPYSTPLPGAAIPANTVKPIYQSRFDGQPFTGTYNLVTFLYDFVPGAQTPLHFHGGQVVATVLQGEITTRAHGVDTVYKTGQAFTELPGDQHQALNLSGASTRLFVSVMLPAGQSLTTIVPARPLPNTGPVAGPSLLFPQTGFTVTGALLAYWHNNGGLAIFGYPIDSARQVDGLVSQWFERARLEEHPENAAPYNVELGLLGSQALALKGIDWSKLPAVTGAPPDCHYFVETGHSLCGEFMAYWHQHGLEFDGLAGTSYAEALALTGFPISEPALETNSSGDTVLTQWFERARLELHPANPAPYRVLLGRLGAELK